MMRAFTEEQLAAHDEVIRAEVREAIATAIAASIDNPIVSNGITEYTEGVRDATAAAARIARSTDTEADEASYVAGREDCRL